MDRHSHIDFR